MCLTTPHHLQLQMFRYLRKKIYKPILSSDLEKVSLPKGFFQNGISENPWSKEPIWVLKSRFWFDPWPFKGAVYSTLMRLLPNFNIEVTSAEIMCIFPHAGEPLNVSGHGDHPWQTTNVQQRNIQHHSASPLHILHTFCDPITSVWLIM